MPRPLRPLAVDHDQIVDSTGATVRLRGTCIGGWMNMEDFITGHPGAEHTLRETLAEVLGPGRATFFFDRLLDHFFAEDDVAFLASVGASAIRIPLNYRHFESDAAPFEYLEAGFARLDRALGWCARHGVYVILDLHAVQGWQNADWHSDNANRVSLFWDHRQLQDRFVGLWTEFARRYRGNPTVAGYNVMNEPVTNSPRGRSGEVPRPRWNTINAIYRRVVEAIRKVDPDHIIFLEGDCYSRLFSGLDAPFSANLVYSSHNYTSAGYGPGAYPSETWSLDYQRREFEDHEGTQFTRRHRVPLWVGEFGSRYTGPAGERPDRLRALADQLDVFEAAGAHWTTWTYKDVGVMGMVELDPQADYLVHIAPILRAKRELATDFWMQRLPPTRATELVDELARLAEQAIGDPEIDPQANRGHLGQAALSGYIAALMQPAFAKRFKGLSEAEIDRILESFAFRKCKPRLGLVDILRQRMAEPALGGPGSR